MIRTKNEISRWYRKPFSSVPYLSRAFTLQNKTLEWYFLKHPNCQGYLHFKIRYKSDIFFSTPTVKGIILQNETLEWNSWRSWGTTQKKKFAWFHMYDCLWAISPPKFWKTIPYPNPNFNPHPLFKSKPNPNPNQNPKCMTQKRKFSNDITLKITKILFLTKLKNSFYSTVGVSTI